VPSVVIASGQSSHAEVRSVTYIFSPTMFHPWESTRAFIAYLKIPDSLSNGITSVFFGVPLVWLLPSTSRQSDTQYRR
jgi:hypothetical protein